MLVTDNRVVERIDRQRILSTLGYSTDAVISARISSLVDEYTENSYHIINPAYSYVIRNIHSVQGKNVTIDGEISFSSAIIARLLEQCERVAIFTLTIGSHLEKIVAALAEDGRVLRATVLDAIGSNAAERVAELVHSLINEEARTMGLCTSRRFSPGYCDWDISQQEMVFSAMKDNSGGVSLSEGYLMLPRKSISGIIGLGRRDSNMANYDPCITCLKRNCTGRRV